MKKFTRIVDRVTFKGSNKVYGLFTVDMDVDNLKGSKEYYNKINDADNENINGIIRELISFNNRNCAFEEGNVD